MWFFFSLNTFFFFYRGLHIGISVNNFILQFLLLFRPQMTQKCFDFMQGLQMPYGT